MTLEPKVINSRIVFLDSAQAVGAFLFPVFCEKAQLNTRDCYTIPGYSFAHDLKWVSRPFEVSKRFARWTSLIHKVSTPNPAAWTGLSRVEAFARIRVERM